MILSDGSYWLKLVTLKLNETEESLLCLSNVDQIESYLSQGKVNWESSIYSLVLVLFSCHLLFSQPRLFI